MISGGSAPDRFFSPAGNTIPKPVAEDVLIQKIPGDRLHSLLIAYYSRENYPGKFVQVPDNGSPLVFRDDGKGEDKIAGDGYFTAKIVVDIDGFRDEAVTINDEIQLAGYPAFHFVNREMIQDPNKADMFNLAKFDAFEPVSVAGLKTYNKKIVDSLRTHSLFLTALPVVEDPKRTWNPCTQQGNPEGPWTFQFLMRQLASRSPGKLASDSEVSDFVLKWLDNWSVSQVINGDTVAARPLLKQVLTIPWLQKSAAEGLPKGQLDMKYAPFRLLAIVNRFDQRESFDGEPAGEARFIFTLLDAECTDSKAYTVAFEYVINKPADCDSIRSWASQWYNLKDLIVGSEAYNAALEKITNQFTVCGSNVNGVNQSSLKSLRSNDQALTSKDIPTVGEFREFVLDPASHLFVLRPVTNAAADRYNVKMDNQDVERFANYVNTHQTEIISGNFTLPLTYLDAPFLGGKTRIIGGIPVGEPPVPFHWDGTEEKSKGYIRSAEARHMISLNACSGCHAGETQTEFWQTFPTFYGTESPLSGFLAGKAGPGGIDFDNKPDNDSMTVMDASLRPSSNPRMYVYNDILRRALDLYQFLASPCGTVLNVRNELMFKPVNMVH